MLWPPPQAQEFNSTKVHLVAKRVRLFDKAKAKRFMKEIKQLVGAVAGGGAGSDKWAAAQGSAIPKLQRQWFQALNDAKLVTQHTKDYAMHVADTLACTPDDVVPEEEQRRRGRIRAQRYGARVRVNGCLVARTPPFLRARTLPF